MPIRRKEYLDIAGIDLELFKTLNRRNQVPLIAGLMAPFVGKDHPGSLQDDDSGYTAAEALMLAFANHLVEENSFTRDRAAHLFSGIWPGLPQAVRRAELGEDIWYLAGAWNFGHAMQPAVDGDHGAGSRSAWDFQEYGSLTEVVSALEEEEQVVKAQGGWVANVAMFRMTPIVRDALERARAHGIDSFFSKDFE